MSKEEKNMIVPERRFPEFKNSEKWESKSLGDVIEIKGRIGYRGYTIEDIVNKGEGAVSLSPSNFDGNGSLVFEKCTYISWEKYEESPEIMLEEGFTVLVKTGSSYGKVALVKKLPEKTTINPQIVVLKPINIEPIFLFLIVSHSSIQKQINETVVGGAIPTLSQESISKFEIFIPEKIEQQKIASCLSSLDDLITAHTQKLETLKADKKGLMQQLFPAEGEKVPKLRFEEFRDSGEWEEDIMDNVADFLKGKGISKADISNTGSLPCIRYGELYTQYHEVINAAISFTDLPPDELVLSEANDVIIPSSGETREDIATASCVLKSGIALGGDLNIIRTQINGIFLSYYLTHAKKKAIAKLAQGDAVVHLYSSQLKKLTINFPKSKDEQEKIAVCLFSLDELIKGQAEKIEQLKLHKKGLMQGLFPNVNQ